MLGTILAASVRGGSSSSSSTVNQDWRHDGVPESWLIFGFMRLGMLRKVGDWEIYKLNSVFETTPVARPEYLYLDNYDMAVQKLGIKFLPKEIEKP